MADDCHHAAFTDYAAGNVFDFKVVRSRSGLDSNVFFVAVLASRAEAVVNVQTSRRRLRLDDLA